MCAKSGYLKLPDIIHIRENGNDVAKRMLYFLQFEGKESLRQKVLDKWYLYADKHNITKGAFIIVVVDVATVSHFDVLLRRQSISAFCPISYLMSWRRTTWKREMLLIFFSIMLCMFSAYLASSYATGFLVNGS
eukprot:snap_masked-scaffold_50-processed-gene-1.52-mRNA-1 protein AED:1.00 eAED:1.00 QI:0/0/0/0/1/1/3/0/133